MQKQTKGNFYCDICNNKIKDIQPKETKIAIDDKDMILQYIHCDKCGKVYPVIFWDIKAMRLQNELQSLVDRFNSCKNKEAADKIQVQIHLKMHACRKYNTYLKGKYSGEFSIKDNVIFYHNLEEQENG